MKIPWSLFSQIAGVAGFFGSIIVFIITRFEKRKHIVFSIRTEPMNKEAGFARDDIHPLLTVQITNSSKRPVTADTDSLKVYTIRKTIISGIEWHVIGEGNGQFRKLNQADNLRFICKWTDFFRRCEKLGFNKNKLPLQITILDSEMKCYSKRVKMGRTI